MALVIRINKLKKTTFIYAMTYLLFNLLCFFQYLSMGTEALFVTVLLIIFGFLIPYSEMGIYLFACLPFFNVMNFQLGTTSMYYVLTGIVVLRYLYRGHGYRISQKIVLLCLIVAVTCYNFDATKEYIRWIICLIPLVLFFREDIIQRHLKNIIDKYTLSMLFSSLWGWLMLKAGSSIYDKGYVFSEGTVVIRFAGLVGDSVAYGIQLLFLISFVTVLIFKETEWRKTRLAAVALMYYFGLMTFSKTFLFFMALQILFIYFYWSRRHKRTAKSILLHVVVFMGMLATTVCFARYLLTSNSEWATMMRTRLLAADLSTGRFDVWRYYLNWCTSNWTSLFRGMGFSNYVVRKTFYLSALNRTVNIKFAHNLYIETAVMFGILESIIVFLFLIVWAVKTYIRQRDLIYFLPLIVFLITGLITHGHFEYYFYLNVLLILSIAEDDHTIVARDTTLETANCFEGPG